MLSYLALGTGRICGLCVIYGTSISMVKLLWRWLLGVSVFILNIFGTILPPILSDQFQRLTVASTRERMRNRVVCGRGSNISVVSNVTRRTSSSSGRRD